MKITLLDHQLNVTWSNASPYFAAGKPPWHAAATEGRRNAFRRAAAIAVQFNQPTPVVVVMGTEAARECHLASVQPVVNDRIRIVILSLPAPEALATLTDREVEVVSMTAAGLETAEIARRLSVRVTTVNTHRARAREKLGVKSHAELIRYGMLMPCPELPEVGSEVLA